MKITHIGAAASSATQVRMTALRASRPIDERMIVLRSKRSAACPANSDSTRMGTNWTSPIMPIRKADWPTSMVWRARS